MERERETRPPSDEVPRAGGEAPGDESARPEVKLGQSPLRCPFCHDDVKLVNEDWLACRGCLARHHLRCWHEGAGCSACRTKEFLAAPSRLHAPMARADAHPRGPRLLLVALLVLVPLLTWAAAFAVRRALDARSLVQVRELERLRAEESVARQRLEADEREALSRRAAIEAEALREARARATIAFRNAVTLLECGDAPAALGAIDAALATDPELPGGRALRGRIDLALQRADDAAADAAKALALDFDDTLAHLVRAEVAEKKGDLRQADEEANVALRRASEYRGEALLVRARAKLGVGELEGAAADAQAAIELLPGATAAPAYRVRGLARFHRKTRDLAGAHGDLTAAISFEATAELHAARAEVRVAQGRLLDAIADLEAALAFGPDAAIAARLDAVQALEKGGLQGIQPAVVPLASDPGPFVATEGALFVLDTASNTLEKLARDGSRTGSLALPRGARTLTLVRGELVVACSEAKALAIVDARRATAARTIALEDAPEAVFAGAAAGKLVVLVDRDGGRAIVEVDANSGETVDLVDHVSAEHVAAAGDAFVAQSFPTGTPSVPAWYSLEGARRGEYLGDLRGDRRLGGSWAPFRTTSGGGFVSENAEGTFAFSATLEQRWWTPGRLLAVHPTKPIVVVAVSRGADRPREWFLEGHDAADGHVLWKVALLLPARAGPTPFAARLPLAQVVEGAAGDEVFFSLRDGWASVRLPGGVEKK